MTNLKPEEIKYLFLEEISTSTAITIEAVQDILRTKYNDIFGANYCIHPERTKVFGIIGASDFGPEYRTSIIGYFIVSDKHYPNEKLLDMVILEEYRRHQFGTLAYNMISTIYGSFGIELYMWCDSVKNQQGGDFWHSVVGAPLDNDGDKYLFFDQIFPKTKYYK